MTGKIKAKRLNFSQSANKKWNPEILSWIQALLINYIDYQECLTKSLAENILNGTPRSGGESTLIRYKKGMDI